MVSRRIQGNTELKRINEKLPGLKNGFTAKENQDALDEISKIFSFKDHSKAKSEYCMGVSDNAAEKLSQLKRAEYDKYFSRSHSCHRSNMCSLFVPPMASQREEALWQKYRKKWRCQACCNGNMRLHRMIFEDNKENHPSLLAKAKLISQLNIINRNCAESNGDHYQSLLKDGRAKAYAMYLLDIHGMGEIPLEDGTLIRRCKGEGEGGVSCRELLLSQRRANNRSQCRKCQMVTVNEKASQQARNKNYAKQVHLSSKTPHCSLTREQRKQKNRENQDRKRNITRTLESLRGKLKKKQKFIDEELAKAGMKLSARGKRRHENFKRQTEDAIKIIMKQKEDFEIILKDVLLELFREGFARQKKKNGHEFKKEDVEPIIAQIFEQMNNEIRTLCGKKPEFGAWTYQVTHALFSKVQRPL